jgi:pimeloyl-ACP methyl ester carboxylesterase
VEMKTLDRDGTKLVCWDSGGGGGTVAFVHGWCCDHSFFEPQLEHFAKRGHRVIAFDLRGHGVSDAPEGHYTMGLFADDIAWCLGELGAARPAVIGHSMGGIVAFELAARYPDLPTAIVMLDSSVVRPAASAAAVDSIIQALSGPDRVTTMRNYVNAALFIPTDDAARRTKLLELMAQAPAHVVVSAMQGMRDYDPQLARGRIKAPSLYIAANEPGPRSDMAALRDLLPQLAFGQTVGSGHFCQLEVPEQVNAMIDRFLAIQQSSHGSIVR